MGPGDQIGDYRVIKQIGVGGQAEVVLAECTRHDHPRIPFGTHIALKIFHHQGLSEKSMAHVMERARQLEAFNHPNVVRYLDHFLWGDKSPSNCIVMEYIKGDTVPDWLTKQNPIANVEDDEEEERPLPGMGWENAKACFEHVIEGLIYARDQGFTHRDLKPDNIMIVEGGHNVKVLDFDIARLVEDARTHRTRSGNRAPIHYVAPEYFGDTPFHGDQQSDIYALGVTLYELLCGRQYWEQNNEAVQYLVLNHPALDDFVFPGIKDLIRKATERPRHKRYETFEAFRDDMRRVTQRVISGEQKYRLIRFINKGGFGIVYAGETVDGEVPVAIKRLLPPDRASLHIYEKNRKKLRREANILCHNKCPNIVGYMEYIEPDESTEPFLVMEYLPGMPDTSLAGQIIRRGTLDPEYATKLFLRYAEALCFLHDDQAKSRIIHRDISPDNLYAPDNPEKACLLDLGVARDESATRTFGSPATKLQYAAPEFPNTRGNPQTDIYSLGICLYEALTGKKGHPLSGDKAFAQRVNNPYEFKLDTSTAPELKAYPSLRAIIDKACQPEARKRYLSAARMRSDLMDALAVMQGRATVSSRAEHETEAFFSAENGEDPNDQDGNKTKPLATDKLTNATKVADVEDGRERLNRLKAEVLKVAAILCVMSGFAAAGWYGPSLWLGWRMELAMRNIEQPLQADLATVEQLVQLNQNCLKHAAEVRLHHAKWDAWQKDLQTSIAGMPALFEQTLDRYRTAEPGRIPELADAWRKTEAVWRDEPFTRHQADWRRIMGRLELAIFALAPEMDNLTVKAIEERTKEIKHILHAYFDGNRNAGEVEIALAQATIEKNAMRLVDGWRTVALVIKEDPAKTDANDIETIQTNLRGLQNLVAGLDVRAVTDEFEQIRKQVAERGGDAKEREKKHNAAVSAITKAHKDLTDVPEESLNCRNLESVMRTFDLYYTGLMQEHPKRSEVLRSFKEAFLASSRIILEPRSPTDRLARLEDMNTHLDRFAEYFPNDQDVDNLRSALNVQRSLFVLRIHNSSEIISDVNVDHSQGDLWVPANQSIDFLLTNATQRTVDVELIPRAPWSSEYDRATIPVEITPGGGSEIAILKSHFHVKPVSVAFNIPSRTPPIIAEYMRDGEDRFLPVQTGVPLLIPPGTDIRVRFTRVGYPDHTNTVAIVRGQTPIEPPVFWPPIPDLSRMEKSFGDLKRLFSPIQAEAEAAIRKDLTWAYQFSEIDPSPGLQKILPRFRNQTHTASWPSAKLDWQEISQKLAELRPGILSFEKDVNSESGMIPSKQQELNAVKTALDYYMVWANLRGNSPTNEAFLQKLKAYSHLPNAEFAHTVLLQSVTRDLEASQLLREQAARITGIGKETLRYQAHQHSDLVFDDAAETRLRLEYLYLFADDSPESLNDYDLRLAFALCARIWEHEVEGSIGNVLADSRRTRVSPSWNMETRLQAQRYIKDSAAKLLYILERSRDDEVRKAINYLNALRQKPEASIPKRTAIMLHCVLSMPSNADFDTAIAEFRRNDYQVHAIFVEAIKHMPASILDENTLNSFRSIMVAR